MRRVFVACAAVLLLAPWLAAGDAENQQLYDLLRKEGALEMQGGAVRKHFTAQQLADASARCAYLGNFVFALESSSEPFLYIDDEPAARMKSLGGNLWVLTARLLTGRSHAHYYRIAGKMLGGLRFDTAAYTEDSYAKEGVPQGKLSEQFVLDSQVYRGWKISWWVYASPGVDPATPAPVMVWQDGHRFVYRGKRARLLEVVENLVAQKKIPPLVLLLVAPGYIGDADDSQYVPSPDVNRMRSILYDTVNDDYNKMLLGEIFPQAEKMYKLRSDGYSRGAGGQSSGGVCSFNMAWWRPAAFARVLSRIGSFTALQWRRGQENPNRRFGLDDPADLLESGAMFPTLVRFRDKKNMRVWLEDGSYDHEIPPGSWPLQNIQLANALKLRGYDFYFSFGNAQHNTENGDAELPRAMTWLWRNYDPSKTAEEFTIDPDEKEKPYFRVAIVNR